MKQVTLIRALGPCSEYFVDNGLEPAGSARPYIEYQKYILDDLTVWGIEFEVLDGFAVEWSDTREEAWLYHPERTKFTNFSGYSCSGVAYTPLKQVATFLESLPLQEE